MPISRLVENFLKHSPNFYSDVISQEIDNKHRAVIEGATKNFKNISIDNFRNWEGQSDLEVPASIASIGLDLGALPRNLLKYSYRKIFKRHEDLSIGLSLKDDISIIKMIGGIDLLRENPVNLTPGKTVSIDVDGYKVNPRWLRYLYLTKKILHEKLISKNGIWVDIGSYYGGLQGLVRKYQPENKMVLVDFHHQLCRSYIYLSLMYPEALHILPDQICDNFDLESLPSGAILYLPARDFGRVNASSIDLATNFFSFGEMRSDTFKSYYRSLLLRSANYVYLVNRFVSSPFFEKTYDTNLSVLDYFDGELKIKYFDVFPIHHYMSVERKLFGVKGLRNTSSSYFETILMK